LTKHSRIPARLRAGIEDQLGTGTLTNRDFRPSSSAEALGWAPSVTFCDGSAKSGGAHRAAIGVNWSRVKASRPYEGPSPVLSTRLFSQSTRTCTMETFTAMDVRIFVDNEVAHPAGRSGGDDAGAPSCLLERRADRAERERALGESRREACHMRIALLAPVHTLIVCSLRVFLYLVTTLGSRCRRSLYRRD
jgi:hypothetical protein